MGVGGHILKIICAAGLYLWKWKNLKLHDTNIKIWSIVFRLKLQVIGVAQCDEPLSHVRFYKSAQIGMKMARHFSAFGLFHGIIILKSKSSFDHHVY